MHATRFHIYFAVSLLLLVFDYFGILNGIKDPFAVIPTTTKQTVSSLSRAISNFSTLVFSYSQISEVRNSNTQLKTQQLQNTEKLRQISDENAALRKQLEAPLSPTLSFVPAHVVSVSRYMEIDQGREAGIALNMTVVNGDAFIGKIITVEKNRSRVMLASDPDAKIPAKTSRDTNGIVGGGSGTLALDSVLQKDPLFKDDAIITSGADGTIPRLLIGQTSHINADDSSVYKQATIIPALDYFHEKIVFVVLQ